MRSDNHQVIACHQCGAKNRIPTSKLNHPSVKCGRCGALIETGHRGSSDSETFKLRCSSCKARNRIPAAKLNQGPKCGKCGELIDTADVLSNVPIAVTDANFSEKVLNSPLPVLMYAWASWCSGCQAAGPIVDQFAAESGGKVRVAKLNVDGNPSLSSKFNILSVPFLFIFDKGELQESMPGGMRKHDLMLKMANYL